MTFTFGAGAVALVSVSMGLSSVQQAAREPELPVFHAQSKLVVVPFQVSHGKGYLADLKQGDVELLEDGVPRAFTVFEGPRDHTGIELVLLFDTTTWPMPVKWDFRGEYAFVAHWDAAKARALLEKGDEDTRVSVYHFDGVRLERLSRGVRDATELTGVFHRLLEPIYGNDLTPSQQRQLSVAIEATTKGGIGGKFDRAKVFLATDRTAPSGTPIPLELPDGREILGPSEWPGIGLRGWPLEAAIGALRDAASEPRKALRVMTEFSMGIGGTTTTPDDVADEALALGIPIYPVLSRYQWWIQTASPSGAGGTFLGDNGGGLIVEDAPAGSLAASPGVRAIDAFAKLGSRTGGRSIEGGRQPLSADEVLGVLLRIRDEALARVHSQYRVGFAPGNATNAAREHKLEVRLVTKSVGRVTGGKRRVIY